MTGSKKIKIVVIAIIAFVLYVFYFRNPQLSREIFSTFILFALPIAFLVGLFYCLMPGRKGESSEVLFFPDYNLTGNRQYLYIHRRAVENIVRLFVIVTRSDDVAQPMEKECVYRYFREHPQLDEVLGQSCCSEYDQQLMYSSKIRYNELISAIHKAKPNDSAINELAHALFQVAFSCDGLQPEELNVLRCIIKLLVKDKVVFARFDNMFFSNPSYAQENNRAGESFKYKKGKGKKKKKGNSQQKFDDSSSFDKDFDYKSTRGYASVQAYNTLNLSMTASDSEIKTAYRKLALKYHPDRLRGNVSENDIRSANEKFDKITKAYDLICKERGIK